MNSSAYQDYKIRIRDGLGLLRLALDDESAGVAAALAKSAAVLATAALERFVNDALRDACTAIKATSWDALPKGYRNYMCRQLAKNLSTCSRSILDGNNSTSKQETKLRSSITSCEDALRDPSTWSDHEEFGMFMEGEPAADKINALISQFAPDDRTLFGSMDESGWDRSMILRGLAQLIDTRHAVAHALPGAAAAGPTDVRDWVVASFWVARRIHWFLEEATASHA